jgi:putative AlgH/UPF0301 family transcriptional regulator
MGLMINKTLPDLSFHTLLTQMNIPVGPRSREIKLYSGGPVDRARGFVLHSSDYQSEGMTLSIEGGFGMTASMEVLELWPVVADLHRPLWPWAMPAGTKVSWNPKSRATTG